MANTKHRTAGTARNEWQANAYAHATRTGVAEADSVRGRTARSHACKESGFTVSELDALTSVFIKHKVIKNACRKEENKFMAKGSSYSNKSYFWT